MKLIVVDTETTGIEETDQIVEVAIIDGRQHWFSLVKPSCPVSIGARAVHHITDAELRKAPPIKLLMATHGHRFSADVFVAHNATFDFKMLLQSGIPEVKLPPMTICTWRCARHLWPDADGFSNQVLRYYLDLKVTLPKNLPPHRALSDALVTSALLERMLEERTAEELVAMTKQPVLLGKIRFGSYRGREWKDMDDGYLRFILKKQFDEDTKFTARHWLRERGYGV